MTLELLLVTNYNSYVLLQQFRDIRKRLINMSDQVFSSVKGASHLSRKWVRMGGYDKKATKAVFSTYHHYVKIYMPT